MDFEMKIDARDFLSKLKMTDSRATEAADEALNDVTDELTRIASDIVPFDKGTLQRSHTKTVSKTSRDITAEVEFSVREGDFNYALWLHEGVYKHGEGTQGRSGTVGWSGKRYYAGRKYLERPLKGEEQAFYEYIANKIKQAVGD